MFDFPEIRSHDMPNEMRLLLDTYPREDWEAHPGFKEKTRKWMGAHQMFRRLAGQVRLDAERYLEKDSEGDTYRVRLSSLGGALMGNLHGHHGWEDNRYFPELSAADPRFDAGLELLEKDHADLDKVLEAFVSTANRAIKLITSGDAKAHDEVGYLHKTTGVIEAFLERHLRDEEDLAVPIILHHRLRG